MPRLLPTSVRGWTVLAVVACQLPARAQGQVVGFESTLRSAWRIATVGFPEIKLNDRLVVWFETSQVPAAAMATGAVRPFLNMHVHEADVATRVPQSQPVLDAVVQVDAAGRITSFVAGESRLLQIAALEAIRRRSFDGGVGEVGAERELLVEFAAFPPSRKVQIEEHARQLITGLGLQPAGVQLKSVAFGRPSPKDKPSKDDDIFWHVEAAIGSTRVLALLEPIYGRLVSIDVEYAP